MKSILLFITLTLFTVQIQAQEAKDLFRVSEYKISWLGIDFSHVKLIGGFTQFSGAGKQSVVDVRDDFFPSWNNLVLAEPDKYDLKGMLRKGDVFFDIGMIMNINSNCAVEEMEDYNTPNYTIENIEQFVNLYPIENKAGIGVLMIAESLNKNAQEAHFHFVVINMSTKEILIHERLRGEPTGFGLKNYWAGSIYRIMKDIRDSHYQKWKSKYK